MNLQPYPAYKESSVPWLGEVPEHWEVRQLGRIGTLSKGNGGTKEDEVIEGVPCVRYGDLYTRHQFFIKKAKACVSIDRVANYTPIQYGDVLFAGSGETIEEIGKSAVNLLSEAACCGGDVIIFRPSIAVNAEFLGLAADCPQATYQKSSMGRGITIMHIYGDDLKYLSIALPPIPEQAAIARFLDYIDRRIRRYVRAQRKLITLLEEQKQAVIHRAVTRGLDPNVRLKPSGVEWLGEVPEHWEVKKLRLLFRYAKGQRAAELTNEYIGRHPGPFPVFSGQTECDGLLGRIDWHEFDFSEPVIFVTTVGARAMSTRLVSGCFSLSQNCALIIPRNSEANTAFFEPVLQRLFDYEKASISLIMQPSLRFGDLNRFYVPCPPLAEQVEIANAIKASVSTLDSSIGRLQRRNDLIQEYRTRLIADVVTGKLDVRQAAAELPDEVPEPDDLDELEEMEENESMLDAEEAEAEE